ncbi:MAG: hypothetical protein IJG87_08830 [Ruminococcus sp.]|nr:hypothetical protein [Ruminococcus sp.]
MRRDGNKGVISGVFGILFVIAGVITIIFGNNIYNNFYEQVQYYYQYGGMDNTGKKIVTVGIALIVIGAILLFISLYFAVAARRQFAGVMHNQEFDEVDDVIEQMAGTKTIFDVFHNEDRTKVFSFYRNKTCIFKEGDKVYHGKMEPLEWENDRPTLWRITLDYKGHEEILEISKVEGNIKVKNDTGEAIFYRGQ